MFWVNFSYTTLRIHSTLSSLQLGRSSSGYLCWNFFEAAGVGDWGEILKEVFVKMRKSLYGGLIAVIEFCLIDMSSKNLCRRFSDPFSLRSGIGSKEALYVGRKFYYKLY